MIPASDPRSTGGRTARARHQQTGRTGDRGCVCGGRGAGCFRAGPAGPWPNGVNEVPSLVNEVEPHLVNVPMRSAAAAIAVNPAEVAGEFNDNPPGTETAPLLPASGGGRAPSHPSRPLAALGCAAC
jgi:hypothetical protein